MPFLINRQKIDGPMVYKRGLRSRSHPKFSGQTSQKQIGIKKTVETMARKIFLLVAFVAMATAELATDDMKESSRVQRQATAACMGPAPAPPRKFLPGPPPFVPGPPPFVPGPPPFLPGPPPFLPGPPAFVPGPPPFVPGPPGFFPGPPAFIPGPPGYYPGPPAFVPGPPPYGPPPGAGDYNWGIQGNGWGMGGGVIGT